MRTGNQDHRTLSEINVTPLVDVMLVLLIIFMVTAPMMEQGIEIDLPQASAKALESKEKQLILTITRDNEIYLNKRRCELEGLRNKLKELYNNRSDKEIYLRADSKVPYGFVIKTMAEIKGAGIEDLALITEPYEEGR
ncbi:MAG: protein TolR [Deltaproteobacteria bacterium]|nr:MAG: protein TolR [Deltaproteobacteria bacterium]